VPGREDLAHGPAVVVAHDDRRSPTRGLEHIGERISDAVSVEAAPVGHRVPVGTLRQVRQDDGGPAGQQQRRGVEDATVDEGAVHAEHRGSRADHPHRDPAQVRRHVQPSDARLRQSLHMLLLVM